MKRTLNQNAMLHEVEMKEGNCHSHEVEVHLLQAARLELRLEIVENHHAPLTLLKKKKKTNLMPRDQDLPNCLFQM